MVRSLFKAALAVVVAVMGSASAEAANPANYAFTCDQLGVNLTLVSFSVQVPPVVFAGGQVLSGVPGDKGNVFTIVFPAEQGLLQILQDGGQDKHLGVCTLNEKISMPAGQAPVNFVYTFNFATLTEIVSVGSDASPESSAGANAPNGMVRASFHYLSIHVESPTGRSAVPASGRGQQK